MKKNQGVLGCLMLAFLVLNAGTETSKGEDSKQVAGVLGGPVTFQLKISQPFTQINWLKSVASAVPSIVATLNLNGQCKLHVLLPAFQGRLNVADDCKRLEVRNLSPDDSGSYTAQIQLPSTGGPLKESFALRVYKRLSGADITIQCNKTGNETRRLKCSVRPWEDGVEFAWTNTSKADILGESPVFELRANDPDLNLTCTATNPISSASRTVSLKEVCDAEHPGARTSTQSTPLDADKGNVGSYVGIAFGVILGVVVVAFMVWFCLKKRKAGRWKYSDSAETREQSKTIYAEVDNVSNDVGMQKSGQRKKPVKAEKEKIQTIYTTVDHCKPNPLQTDDEKVRKGRRPPRDGTLKTTYAEIAAPQESEDRSIKSIYETVKNPQLPQGTEYHIDV